jgi:hypothetical protein
VHKKPALPSSGLCVNLPCSTVTCVDFPFSIRDVAQYMGRLRQGGSFIMLVDEMSKRRLRRAGEARDGAQQLVDFATCDGPCRRRFLVEAFGGGGVDVEEGRPCCDVCERAGAPAAENPCMCIGPESTGVRVSVGVSELSWGNPRRRCDNNDVGQHDDDNNDDEDDEVYTDDDEDVDVGDEDSGATDTNSNAIADFPAGQSDASLQTTNTNAAADNSAITASQAGASDSSAPTTDAASTTDSNAIAAAQAGASDVRPPMTNTNGNSSASATDHPGAGGKLPPTTTTTRSSSSSGTISDPMDDYILMQMAGDWYEVRRLPVPADGACGIHATLGVWNPTTREKRTTGNPYTAWSRFLSPMDCKVSELVAQNKYFNVRTGTFEGPLDNAWQNLLHSDGGWNWGPDFDPTSKLIEIAAEVRKCAALTVKALGSADGRSSAWMQARTWVRHLLRTTMKKYIETVRRNAALCGDTGYWLNEGEVRLLAHLKSFSSPSGTVSAFVPEVRESAEVGGSIASTAKLLEAIEDNDAGALDRVLPPVLRQAESSWRPDDRLGNAKEWADLGNPDDGATLWDSDYEGLLYQANPGASKPAQQSARFDEKSAKEGRTMWILNTPARRQTSLSQIRASQAHGSHWEPVYLHRMQASSSASMGASTSTTSISAGDKPDTAAMTAGAATTSSANDKTDNAVTSTGIPTPSSSAGTNTGSYNAGVSNTGANTVGDAHKGDPSTNASSTDDNTSNSNDDNNSIVDATTSDGKVKRLNNYTWSASVSVCQAYRATRLEVDQKDGGQPFIKGCEDACAITMGTTQAMDYVRELTLRLKTPFHVRKSSDGKNKLNVVCDSCPAKTGCDVRGEFDRKENKLLLRGSHCEGGPSRLANGWKCPPVHSVLDFFERSATLQADTWSREVWDLVEHLIPAGTSMPERAQFAFWKGNILKEANSAEKPVKAGTVEESVAVQSLLAFMPKLSQMATVRDECEPLLIHQEPGIVHLTCRKWLKDVQEAAVASGTLACPCFASDGMYPIVKTENCTAPAHYFMSFVALSHNNVELSNSGSPFILSFIPEEDLESIRSVLFGAEMAWKQATGTELLPESAIFGHDDSGSAENAVAEKGYISVRDWYHIIKNLVDNKSKAIHDTTYPRVLWWLRRSRLMFDLSYFRAFWRAKVQYY